MSNTLITFPKDAKRHMVQAPEFEYEIGDIFEVEDKIRVDGEERDVFYYQIDDRTREYIVAEDEWYIDYNVIFCDGFGMVLAECKLSENDIREDGFEKEPNKERILKKQSMNNWTSSFRR
jgi:hypothetical protein